MSTGVTKDVKKTTVHIIEEYDIPYYIYTNANCKNVLSEHIGAFRVWGHVFGIGRAACCLTTAENDHRHLHVLTVPTALSSFKLKRERETIL